MTERSDWLFARKGDGYLALCSQHPYVWGTRSPLPMGEELGVRASTEEIIVDARQNIWLCQLGRKADDGTFEQFIDSISLARLAFRGMNVEYQSPGNGLVRFGWEGGFSVDGVEIQLHDYPRYDNPYVKAEFDPTEIHITTDEHELYLNWKTEERKTR